MNIRESVKQNFLRYVKIDTQGDPEPTTFPSTAKQFDLLNLLLAELKALGIADAAIDQYGYVTGTIKSNTEKKVPVISFHAHVDTALEVTGAGVNPQIHSNYDGGDIKLLKEDKIIKANENPYLKTLIGKEIITTDGSTLLGADDKSGVAVLMTAVEYLQSHPEVKHGDIKFAFNPDEEIGRGMEFFNIEKFGADFGYTMDASNLGEIEYENFNAQTAIVKFKGFSIHPGYAKDKMINAIKLASKFISLLPNEFSPEHTEGYQGFVHPIDVKGGNEEAEVTFIVRDHEYENLKKHTDLLTRLATQTIENHGGRFEINIEDSYRNMRDIIKNDMRVVDYALEAMKNIGLETHTVAIRGGTDGARLTYMGLPCPNLFTGMQNFHGKLEYIAVEDMEKSVETVIEVCRVWEMKS